MMALQRVENWAVWWVVRSAECLVVKTVKLQAVVSAELKVEMLVGARVMKTVEWWVASLVEMLVDELELRLAVMRVI